MTRETRKPADVPPVRVRYEQSMAAHASQFVISATSEELFLDASSGIVVDETGDGATLPIHTRLAMSWQAAARLRELLEQAIANQQTRAAAGGPGAGPPIAPVSTVGTARLPSLGGT